MKCDLCSNDYDENDLSNKDDFIMTTTDHFCQECSRKIHYTANEKIKNGESDLYILTMKK